jgi:hypothetical protein
MALWLVHDSTLLSPCPTIGMLILTMSLLLMSSPMLKQLTSCLEICLLLGYVSTARMNVLVSSQTSSFSTGISRMLKRMGYRIIWFTPPSLDYTPTQYIAPCNYHRSLNVYIYTPMGVCRYVRKGKRSYSTSFNNYLIGSYIGT